jgi:V/A-type H+-transporting ATPase subunit B
MEYSGLASIRGPLVFIDRVREAGLGELVEIRDGGGALRTGQVVEVDESRAIVQVFEGTSGLSLTGTRSVFLGRPLRMPVSRDMLGRIFDGLGRPVDGAPRSHLRT